MQVNIKRKRILFYVALNNILFSDVKIIYLSIIFYSILKALNLVCNMSAYDDQTVIIHRYLLNEAETCENTYGFLI